MQQRKPTLKQKLVMKRNNMNPEEWYVLKVLPDRLICSHKYASHQRKEAFFEAVVLR